MKKVLFTLSLLMLFGVVNSQETGTLTGLLADKETNDSPLPFANITLKGTTKGTTSDFDGLYTIDNIAPGTYDVEFSFVGYEVKTVTGVVIKSGETTTVNTSLGASAAALDEIIITAEVNREKEIGIVN